MTTWNTETLRQELTKPWRHGEHVDAQGCEIASTLDLRGGTIRSFDLSDARLGGDFVASGATFAGMAWLHRAKVTGTAYLTGCKFRNDLRLDGLRCDMLDLSNCRFEGVLCVDHAQIGALILKNSLCLANLSMAGTRVHRMCRLEDTEIMGGIWQADAILENLIMNNFDIYGRNYR